jgi:peptidoglycan hydrolase-like protein with peptidoglycan-binding domain
MIFPLLLVISGIGGGYALYKKYTAKPAIVPVPTSPPKPIVPAGYAAPVSTVKPSAPVVSSTPTIQEGTKDTASTKKWQMLIGVSPDGIFGPDTTIATKAWQSARGIWADGIVGAQTWAVALKEQGSAPQVAKAIADIQTQHTDEDF